MLKKYQCEKLQKGKLCDIISIGILPSLIRVQTARRPMPKAEMARCGTERLPGRSVSVKNGLL